MIRMQFYYVYWFFVYFEDHIKWYYIMIAPGFIFQITFLKNYTPSMKKYKHPTVKKSHNIGSDADIHIIIVSYIL